jgi:choline trimethylamine-lyase
MQPSLAVRYHDNIPKELVLKTIDVIHTGVGYPAYFNDKTLIPHLLMEGLSLEDARNYGITGCVDIYIPGKNRREKT